MPLRSSWSCCLRMWRPRVRRSSAMETSPPRRSGAPHRRARRLAHGSGVDLATLWCAEPSPLLSWAALCNFCRMSPAVPRAAPRLQVRAIQHRDQAGGEARRAGVAGWWPGGRLLCLRAAVRLLLLLTSVQPHFALPNWLASWFTARCNQAFRNPLPGN